MQIMYAVIAGEDHQLLLPPPEVFVVPGVRWGRFDELLTPAYWKGQAWQHEQLGTFRELRLGRTLAEEVAACLLGGYGMPAELALAAFARLRDSGLLVAKPKAKELEEALAAPFRINGRLRRYRFVRQKARYLSACLESLPLRCGAKDDVEFRNQLAELPGIGMKTSSWIVRNFRGSNSVAIIDVHILRAGRHIGLFDPDWDPQRNYGELETAFLQFAHAITVPASTLDALMWDHMRRVSAALNRIDAGCPEQLDLFRSQPVTVAVDTNRIGASYAY